MDRAIELVPLVCPQCSTPVPAEINEVAWVCAQCGLGLCLDEEKGLAPIEVHYAAGIPDGGRGRPFWVVEGRVSLQRESYDSARKEAEQARQFWGEPRHFSIPAFDGTLESLLSQGLTLLRQPPPLQPGSKAAFEPVTLHPLDLRAAVEFLVVAVEAERKDRVKEIQFDLQLSPAVLWILP